ncbi:MAG: EAL domain-containing protein, partial [Anaerolineales bacterium]
HVGSYKIVQTVVKLAKNLGMQVVAEGVEHDGQLEIIRALECEFAQGYYFSRPVAAQEAEALLLGVHPGHLIDDQIPAPQPRDTRTRG